MADQIKYRVGQQLGNYRLVNLLGRGGFAEVYLGQHVFLNTEAAIKILHTQLEQGKQADFLNEARTIAQLVHSHIVRVLDFGVQEDTPFLVMDYAPNGSLRQRHPKGSRLPITTVISYVQQVATALQYAHDRKLIHRDVKPENMLVARDEEILLSDFGISVVAHETQSQSTQEVVGSVPYMAPEQIQGKARYASDQYSLAIVVYEWLAGERPFQGNFTELYGKHLYSPPPPLREKNPQIPEDIEYVVMMALAKDPQQRFASVRAFANALEQAYHAERQRALAAEPNAPTLPRATHEQKTLTAAQSATALSQQNTLIPAHVSRRMLLLGGAAGLAVIAGGGFAWYSLSHTYPEQGKMLYTFNGFTEAVRAVSWKGDRLAATSTDKTVKIWDATNGGHQVTYSGHSDTVNAIAWAPDGSRIASAGADNTVQVWDATSARLITTYKGHGNSSFSGVLAVAWSPDGNYIASGGSDGSVRIWDPSGQTKYVYHDTQQFGNPTVSAVAWSPDSQLIASGDSNNTVQIWEALTGKRHLTYTGHSQTVNSVAWSPDGTSIASAGDDKTVQVWDVAQTDQVGLVNRGHKSQVYSVAWSPDGTYVASASDDQTVQIWKPKSTDTPYFYKQHTKSVRAVAWSEDSHRAASGGDDQLVFVWEAV